MYSDTLTAQQIAEVLGREPDWAVGTGVEAQAADAPLPSNGWFLESFGNVDSPELDDHLAWAVDRLADRTAALAALRDALDDLLSNDASLDDSAVPDVMDSAINMTGNEVIICFIILMPGV